MSISKERCGIIAVLQLRLYTRVLPMPWEHIVLSSLSIQVMNDLKPDLAGQFGTLQQHRLPGGNLISTSYGDVRLMLSKA